jgi:hypothetical protein
MLLFFTHGSTVQWNYVVRCMITVRMEYKGKLTVYLVLGATALANAFPRTRRGLVFTRSMCYGMFTNPR